MSAPAASAPSSAPPAGAGAFRGLLASREFRLFWSAQALTLLGEFFGYIALSWLVLQVTGSAGALGGVLAAQAIPRAVLMLVGGAASDRLSARAQMLTSSLVRAALTAALAALAGLHVATLWEIYVLAVLLGGVSAFFIPARSAMLPTIVEAAQLGPANAAVQLSQQAAGALGPALAGALVALAGPAWAIAVDALAFLAAAALLAPVRPTLAIPEPGAAPAAGGLVSSIREGLAHAWNDVPLRALMLLLLVVNFAFAGPLNVGLAVIARERLGGAAGYGTAVAAWGVGAVAGALLAGVLPAVRHFGLVLVLAIAGMGVMLGLVGFLPTLLPVLAVMAVAGVGNGYILTVGITWIQRRVPGALLGRVTSLIMLASIGLAPLSLAVAGALAGLRPELLFGAAALLVVVTSAGTLASRSLRTLEAGS